MPPASSRRASAKAAFWGSSALACSTAFDRRSSSSGARSAKRRNASSARSRSAVAAGPSPAAWASFAQTSPVPPERLEVVGVDVERLLEPAQGHVRLVLHRRHAALGVVLLEPLVGGLELGGQVDDPLLPDRLEAVEGVDLRRLDLLEHEVREVLDHVAGAALLELVDVVLQPRAEDVVARRVHVHAQEVHDAPAVVVELGLVLAGVEHVAQRHGRALLELLGQRHQPPGHRQVAADRAVAEHFDAFEEAGDALVHERGHVAHGHVHELVAGLVEQRRHERSRALARPRSPGCRC
jgi:hypothetical protein